MRTKAHNQNRFLRIITFPIRVLGKAKDLYVRGLTDCAARGYGHNMGGPTSMPRSYSYASSGSHDNDDFRELVRAASANTLGHGVDLHELLQQSAPARSKMVPRSCSVGMARIDEDGPCELGEVNFKGKANLMRPRSEVNKAKSDLMYPRSRSYAVTNRSVGF